MGHARTDTMRVNMRTKRKARRQNAKRLPGLPKPVPKESIALLDYIRTLGVRRRSFSILQSSESRLKRHETIYQL
jgi:hypothetical protein